mmetsp:Transcript_6948/g.23440  ORF Transcript_6948/g.23440 Transcript_6948/m.23440 type:complete len:237 (+) Transcript_6948:370-1080(+)
MHSPVRRSRPTASPVRSCSSSTLMTLSCTSRPEFSASVLGMTSSAWAKASSPSLALPLTAALRAWRCRKAPTSNAPAPATTAPSSTAFFTARRPSRTASLIWATVCSLGPLMRMEHERGLRQPSTKVNLSSPSVSCRTVSAKPSTSLVRSSTEFTCMPPHASVRRSMLRRLARRRAMTPSFANMSSARGSMPFWLITTKVSPSSHTRRLNSITARTLSSVKRRSLSTSLSRSSAEL